MCGPADGANFVLQKNFNGISISKSSPDSVNRFEVIPKAF